MKMLSQTSVTFWSLPAPCWSQMQKLSRGFRWWNESRPAIGQQRFKINSDLTVDRHIRLREIRGRPDMLASLCKSTSFKLVCLTNNYRCCTVLLVLNNSVSNFTNLYLFNQNVENLHIQTLPSNSPSPIPWPWDVCLELSYLLPLFEKILDPPLAPPGYE